MRTRGIAGAVVLLLAGAGPVSAAQDGKQESGKYRLSVAGRETGSEEFRLEEFEDGKVVLFSKSRFELALGGTRRSYVTDTVLTMDRSFAPTLYAGYRKAGREEEKVRIEWDKGVAVTPRKQIRTSAAYLLDPTALSHLIPILRGIEPGRRKVTLFNPTALADFEGSIEDRGDVLLRGKEASIRVREIQVNLGYVSFTAHVDSARRMVRAYSAVSNSLGELEGFEGFVPEAIAPEGVEETEVTFPSGSLRLAGTVSRPRGAAACPAVLLLPDTGPHDRQGNLVRGKGGSEEFAWPGAQASLLRALAQSLAGAGFLVLRYDDRGCGASEGDFSRARFTDLVADAACAVAFLRGRADAGPVGLVGHGEGALAACVLSAADGAIKTIVLLAPPPVPLSDLALARAERALREQGTKEEILRQMLDSQRRLFERIRSSSGDTQVIDERPTFVGWMRERILLDPREALAKAPAAALICLGGRDREVAPDQARALRGVRAGIDLRVFEGLDHAFAGPDGRVDPDFLRSLAERLPQNLR